MKYNRLELLLLGNLEIDILDYQPLFKEYGVYMLGSTSFLSYGKRLSLDTKKEIIQKISNHKIKIYEDSNYSDGYFDWWNCAFKNKVVLFSFFHVRRGCEHEALPFVENAASIYYCPELGLLKDGTILTKSHTQKLVSEIEEESRIIELEAIAKCKYQPNLNLFQVMNIEMWMDEQFGRVKTQLEINKKYKELANIHHPDKGGNELMFKAITAARDYLKEKYQ